MRVDDRQTVLASPAGYGHPADHRAGWSTATKALAVLACFAAYLTLTFTTYTAWGLAALLPSTTAQLAAAAVGPLVIVLATLVGERAHARDERYPSSAFAALTGALVAMLLVAPPPGRGAGWSALVDHVPVLLFTTYGAYVALFLLFAWLTVRKVARLDALDDDVVAEPAGFPRAGRRRTAVLAACLPLAVVAVAVPAGVRTGDPLYPELQQVSLTVPELDGSSLDERVSTVELKGMTALEPSFVADALTDGQPMERGWEIAARTAATPAAPMWSTVFITVSELADDADPDAAAAHLRAAAEGDPPLPEGWLAPFTQPDAAAVLDGDFLVVLRVNGGGTHASRTTLVRTLAGELTAQRWAALVDATDPGTR